MQESGELGQSGNTPQSIAPRSMIILEANRGQSARAIQNMAQGWLHAAGIDLKWFQEDVDRDLKPRSNASTGIRVSGRVALRAIYAKTENLAGLIPGRGALKNEYVVVGAHYDHLGYGGDHSMRPNEHAIHNGADDNASGTWPR